MESSKWPRHLALVGSLAITLLTTVTNLAFDEDVVYNELVRITCSGYSVQSTYESAIVSFLIHVQSLHLYLKFLQVCWSSFLCRDPASISILRTKHLLTPLVTPRPRPDLVGKHTMYFLSTKHRSILLWTLHLAAVLQLASWISVASARSVLDFSGLYDLGARDILLHDPRDINDFEKRDLDGIDLDARDFEEELDIRDCTAMDPRTHGSLWDRGLDALNGEHHTSALSYKDIAEPRVERRAAVIPSMREVIQKTEDGRYLRGKVSVFWSGLGNAGYITARNWGLQKFGSRNRFALYNECVDGSVYQKWNTQAPTPLQNEQLIERMSGAFAWATREAIVYMLKSDHDTIRPSSTWLKLELPTLTRNPHVERIIQVSMPSGRQTELWKKGQGRIGPSPVLARRQTVASESME